MNLNEVKICVVGLGYVGLPLAVEFSKVTDIKVVGFDISEEKISKLNKGIDPTREVGDEEIKKTDIEFTADSKKISEANFIIVAVPTPIYEETKKPDLSLVESASKIVGRNLKAGSTVVYESTVYPGVTEEICLPILEKESGLKNGVDFKIGYSPERVNPGDKQHTIDKIIKVVSGQDQDTLEKVASVYGLVCKAGVHRAPNIKTAEAAKVIENIQRDLNIALMNELALIFEKLDINTQEVIEAAGTKWNFHKYLPGLVGGHCIGVDPYYLTYRAQQLGYEPKVILAGRNLNDAMAGFVAKKVLNNLEDSAPRILVMGLTFKENVNDFRNSKVKDVITNLKSAGATVFATDPFAINGESESIFGLSHSEKKDWQNLDAIMCLVPHDQFKSIELSELKTMCKDRAVLFDLKQIYNKKEAENLGFKYLTL
ncbi:MAG: nucleotide sugar dehydrogenase [Candidatus Buchananbacteria bacterium]|nr:nucleotide sugar dehydrogenase [Candidatus Buchananbacteria bacterium]